MAQEPKPINSHSRKEFFSVLKKQVFQANEFKAKIALLLIDIDRFYKINQTFGYELGDILLEKFGLLLKSAIRPQDYLAKIGDNQYAIILNGIMNTGHAELAAHKIHRLAQVPFTIEEKQVKIDCTIAISLCPTHASHWESLLKESEIVLRNAKAKGTKLVISSVVEHENNLSENWDIEIELEGVLNREELILYYQPKISLKTGEFIGAEALLRWVHSTRGFISPGVFIPIAEQMGYMKQITNWVMNTALRQAAEWTEIVDNTSVSINVPPDLVLAPDFSDQVNNAINLWANDKTHLTLEIIERSFVHNPEKSFTILQELREKGIAISIDDFGTGYSSLSYFEQLPVDELKINQSFVSNLIKSESSRHIIKLILDLAKAFDMKVVAEGIEELEEAQYLQKNGCDIAQGYYFAKPMPQNELIEWLRKKTSKQ